MSLRVLWAAAAAGFLAATPVMAREPFDDAYFVRPGGGAVDMLKDRAQCSASAQGMGTTAAAYTDPQYGALNAMSQELDSNALHDGGMRKRLHRAVFVDCMKRMGWAPLDPTPEDARRIGHASERHPEALDAWLKANEPAPPAPPPVVQVTPPPAPAAQAAFR